MAGSGSAPAGGDGAGEEGSGVLDAEMRAFIAASPLLFIGSGNGEAGADMSPRGDKPGFVELEGRDMLLLPDRIGNNRLDTLTNVIGNPAIALIFLQPGSHAFLRVEGKARVSVNPAWLRKFAAGGRPPRTVLAVLAETARLVRSDALAAADFWTPAARETLDALPSFAEIVAGQVGGMTTEQVEELVVESYTQRLY